MLILNECRILIAINNSLVILNRLSAPKFFLTHLIPHRPYTELCHCHEGQGAGGLTAREGQENTFSLLTDI